MIANMTVPALRLRGVSQNFGSFQALSSVDLEVGAGDIYGFLGLNGAGKTTAIRLILGLLRHRTGTIEIFGSELRRAPPEIYRNVGVLFEDFTAPGYLTGREHLRLHAKLLGMPRREARAAAERWLDRVSLLARADAKVRAYSLGMRRRLGLACALVGAPRLVILDEPTNGLDPKGIADFRSLILELHRESGVTFFLSSHILGEVEHLCHRIGILHQGRMRVEGAVADLTGRTQNRVRVRALPLSTARRVIEASPCCGRIENAGPDALSVTVPSDDVPALVRALVGANVAVHEVAACSESLESVFHQATADLELGSEQLASSRQAPGERVRRDEADREAVGAARPRVQ